ncbi:hypothetical protein KKE78_02270 [Patescibacteria group bacterium]|nr:hypothetical protein [Patescibacteria group bacterium]
MSVKKTISKKFGSLIIKPDQLIKLSKVCYEPWRRDLEAAQRKWRNERLPEIEKKIDKHNKDVKAKKSVYSFNTYLPIGEDDKKAITEKERDYYIFTSQRVYDFHSKFKVSLKDEEFEHSKPGFLEDIDLEKAKKLNFSVESKNGNRIELTVRNNGAFDEELTYKIEGEDERWITKTKQSLEKIIREVSSPHEITRYKFWIALFSTIALSLTFYKILIKLNILDFSQFFINTKISNVVATILFSVFLLIRMLKILNNVFPNFTIKSNYKPFDSNFVLVGGFLVTAVLSPIIWAIIEFLFIK